jgi:hypothetical protein
MTPENGISEHWLLRGIQSAFFFYVSCGPCIVMEAKVRRKTQARRERRIREKNRREKMEYKRKKREAADAETGDEDDDDHVIELEVTDPAGSHRLVGVGLSGNKEEHIFLPFEVNEYWGDECSPETGAPWWWRKLTGQEPKAIEPPAAVGTRGLSRKRYFRPAAEHEWEDDKHDSGRDDADLYPLNDSHPPILCRGEISKEEVSWIKDLAPPTDTMRRIQGDVFEVDLDVLGRTDDWTGDISTHPAVRKVDFAAQLLEKRSTMSRNSSTSLAPSPKPKAADSEGKSADVDAITKLSPSISATGNQYLSLPSKGERATTPTTRPDSAISASRLKPRSQTHFRRIRSGSHTGSSASEDADDEDEEGNGVAYSPKAYAVTKPKVAYHRSGKTSIHSQQSENLSPRISPRTVGSAVSSSESLAGESWLPPRMLGARQNPPNLPTGPVPLK